MLTLRKKVAVQIQCYLWIALLMFTTVGCSAKKAFFEVSGLQMERPLNANKALGINQVSCDVETSSVTVSSKQLKQKVKGISLSSLAYTAGVDLALFHHSKGVQLDYILSIAGTDPPKYILYQQFKLAIV